MRIGCLTGGGDAVGLNAAVAGFVRGLINRTLKTNVEVEIVGIVGGWQGLTAEKPEFVTLSLQDVKGIAAFGGTILHTSRENPLKEEAKMAQVIGNMQHMGLYGLVPMGGDDTLSVAAGLSQRGRRVIGVPKTMDLDLSGTLYSVGFWSYVESVVATLRGFITTCRSHRRIGVCEVFGRHSGFTAAAIGLAAEADYIIVPEQVLDVDEMARVMKNNHLANKTGLVIVAEGIKLETGSKGKIDAHDNELLAEKRIGEFIARVIEEKTGIETRPFQASHPFRGEPFAFDSVIGFRFGEKAAEMVLQDQWGKMVALEGGDAISGNIISLPISSFKPRHLIEANSAIYQLVARRNAGKI